MKPDWQPIDTAPLDGTSILVYAEPEMAVVRWIEYSPGISCWHVDDNKHGPFALRGPSPAYWMPLPEPPKEGMP